MTLNIYKALQEFFEIHKEMDNTGYITEEQICGVHRTLMNIKDAHNAGEIQKCVIFTEYNGEKYTYSEPLTTAKLFTAAIDHHTIHMSYYHKEFVEPS